MGEARIIGTVQRALNDNGVPKAKRDRWKDRVQTGLKMHNIRRPKTVNDQVVLFIREILRRCPLAAASSGET